MTITETIIPGVLLLEPKVFSDERGYFFESYSKRTLLEAGIDIDFVQDNQSMSHKNIVRGLHAQKAPYEQGKLVRVLQGAVMDVAVDARKGSPTYGRHVSVELTAENKKQLFIPKGFAHGFSVISEMAEIMYKCDTYYNKESESGILYNDPQLKLDWEIPTDKIRVSEKDRLLPLFKSYAGEFIFIQ